MVPMIALSHVEARAALRTRIAASCRRDLSKVFAAWLLQEAEQRAEFASIAGQAAKREGADQDFQTIAILGFAAEAGLLSGPQVETLKRGLGRLAGRKPVVNGTPMAFCADAVGILGVALGTGMVADAEVTGQVVRWAAKFLRTSYERDQAEEWRRCLFAIADRQLGSPLHLSMPKSAETADVRSTLRARGLIDAGHGNHAKEDAVQTLELAIQDLPRDCDCDRVALRLAALELVLRTGQLPAGENIPGARMDGSVNHTDGPMFVLEAPTPSMDRVLQTDPVWTIRGTQKTPIPVTRLSGEVVWMNPSPTDEPDEAILTPEEELRIAEATLSGRTELRSEIETAFAGPAWPLASAIVEPFRRYAIKVLDVNATVCRRAASTQGRDFSEVLGAMARNLLSEAFGIEWERSPGDKVIRIDWQYGTEGWKGKEIPVIAGNDPDPPCLYRQLIGDAIKYRYRFHDVPPEPIPGEPPGINLSNVEWWQYIGLKERHNLAMAIKPYLEDRKAHWQSVHALSRPTEADSGMATGSRPGDVFRPQSPEVPKESRKAKKPARRNIKYEGIDRALSAISEARPKNHEEVFRFLDDRKAAIPNRKPFKAAGGWLEGFQQNRHAASAWLSQAWGRLDLPAFARGPKK
jgi:hypothetical protein